MDITALIVVLLFIVFDVLTGWLKAFRTGTLNSSIMREGLLNKIDEVLAILFGYLCEFAFPKVGVPVKLPMASCICVYIVLMETTSVVENIAVMNPKLTEILKKVFDTEKLEDAQKGGAHLENKSADSGGGTDGEMGER